MPAVAQNLNHEFYMREALKLAERAFNEGEIPIGAVVVSDNKIIARGYNQVEVLKDPSAHAEMIAITAACHHMGAKYLKGCTLYVTLEPCPMCAGAIHWAQIPEVVFGASDKKKGFRTLSPLMPGSKTMLTEGILADKCEKMLLDFFRFLR